MMAVPESLPEVPAWHRALFAAAATMVFLLVLSGGLVCITDSSHGCPDWPECHGRWIPPAQMNSIIEYSHRLFSPLALPLVLAAVVVAWRRYRGAGWVLVPAVGTVLCLLAVVVLGAMVILTGLSRPWATVDLGLALLALGLMVTASQVVTGLRREPGLAPRLRFTTSLSRLAAATAAAVYLVLVSCVLIARSGALMRCLNWPGVTDLARPEDLFDWLSLARFGAGVVASLLVLALVVAVVRARRGTLAGPAVAAAVLVVAGQVVGALMPTPDRGVFMPLASMAVAAALWAVVVAITVRAGLEDWNEIG